MGDRRFLIRVRGKDIDIARVPSKTSMKALTPKLKDYKVVTAQTPTQAINKHLRMIGAIGPTEYLGRENRKRRK